LFAGFETELKKFYKGLKRDEAEKKQAGLRKATEGKDELMYELYEWISGYFVAKVPSSLVFLFEG
jgi:hypothetical protein